MSGCPDCEELPSSLPKSGVVYLSPPLEHTGDTLSKVFQSLDLSLDEVEDGIYKSSIKNTHYSDLGAMLTSELSDEELQDTRCLFLESDRELTMKDFASMNSLEQLLGQFDGDWLIDLLRKKNLTSHFHPIVKADDTSEVYGYEALLRGLKPDGSTISPGRLFPAAERMDLMFNLDREARISAIESASNHGISDHVFINFNPASIYDPAYCLRTTFEALEETELPPENVVFEVIESEEVMDREQLIEILDHYRDNGFQVALDDVGEGYSSLGMLNELKPDYLKIDMSLVQGISEDNFKAQITRNLLDTAHDLNISVVAEGVETVEEVEWFQEHGADYLQGFYFAKPESPPPSID